MAYEDLEKGGGMKNRGNNRYQPGYYSPTFCWAWLIPMFVMVNIAMFVVVMYVNDCPKKNARFERACVAMFLGRFSFQPLRENPLYGATSST